MDKTLIELSFLLFMTALLLAWVMIIIHRPLVVNNKRVNIEVVGYSHDGIKTTPVCSNPVVVDSLDSTFYVYLSNDMVILDQRYREDLIYQSSFYYVIETSLNEFVRVIRTRSDKPISFNFKFGEY
ncbi:hypothetical protein [Pseudomonas phage vB_PaeM_PS119XW]|uniref:Uncharacterized protein n=2 Tax=root TaxID=1 RepID=A0A5C1K8C9_9CAUD|nr:hypothetical protein PP933_gp330 [Pseudomonas phage vB_PaeM_PS119XW]QEM42059.1 hypothetical protein [Pseudomonas phage vB_PaeM_PS119XW]